MRWVTHAAAGAAAWAAAAPHLHHATTAASLAGGAVVAAAVAPWPDIDNRRSAAAQAVKPLHALVSMAGGHRQGPTHSLLATVLAGLLFALPGKYLHGWPWWAPWAAGAGWLSHCLIDMANERPVRFLWPARAQFQLPKLLCCRWDGPGDLAWRAGMLVLFVFLVKGG